jgi:hypothetical protein
MMVCVISNASWAVVPLGRMTVLETLSSRSASAWSECHELFMNTSSSSFQKQKKLYEKLEKILVHLSMGVFGLTPNVLAQSTVKTVMGVRFLGSVGSLLLDEQKIWLPNQSAQDPQTWLAPNLLHLKEVYEVLLNKHNCKEQESYVVQDQPLPPSDTLLLPSLSRLYKVHVRNQEMPQTGDSRP